MVPETKKIFLEMLNQSKSVTKTLQDFCKAVLLVTKSQLHTIKDEAVIEWTQQNSVLNEDSAREPLTIVARKLNASWNVLFSHVLAKGALFSHGFE